MQRAKEDFMRFEFSLEIVSIFVLGLFLFDFIRIRKFPKASSAILILLSTVAMLIPLLGISTMLNLGYRLNKIIIFMFYFLDGIAYYLTFLYILTTCGKLRSHFMLHILYVLPCLANIGLTIFSFVKNVNFYTNTSALLQPHNVYSFFSVLVPLFYMILCLIFMLACRKKIRGTERACISTLCFVTTACCGFQLFSSNLIMVSIARVTCMGFMYLVIERPTENIDSETGFFNKNALISFINTNIQLNKKFSLIHININNFHIISNLFGYEKTNQLLISIASSLEKLKSSSVLFRMEKDNLIILDTKNRHEQIIKAFKQRFDLPWLINGTEIQLSATIVCAQFPHDFSSVHEGIDFLSYLSKTAKSVGYKDLTYSSPQLVKQFTRLKQVEMALNKAIEQKSLQVYYQPIHDAKTGELVSAEALVRLKDEQLGYIPPFEFISIAENNGSIVEVGNIVFEKVCEFISRYIKPKIVELKTVEINLSSIQCLHPDLADNFIKIMKGFEINPKIVNLELTESAVTASEEMVLNHMNKLKKTGVTFSCDDYGTGYSTCSYLLKFPFKIVKFDYSLTKSYFQNPNAKIIMDNEIKTIKALGFEIVAEGIEREEQLKTFSKLGVNYIQGYYYSKPLSENEFLVYYRACTLGKNKKVAQKPKATKKKTEGEKTTENSIQPKPENTQENLVESNAMPTKPKKSKSDDSNN